MTGSKALQIDPAKLSLSEKDVEQWLFDNPDVMGISKWIGRQYRLPSGIADLVGLNTFGAPEVIEVKNVPIGKAAITQVCRYAHDIQNIAMERVDYPQYANGEPIVHKTVVGTDIDIQTLYEAIACGVKVMEFAVTAQLSLSRTGWSDEHRKNLEEHYFEIARNPEWEIFGQLIADHIAEMAQDDISADVLHEELYGDTGAA